MSNLLLYAIPGFLLSLWLERLWASRVSGDIRGYETRDTLSSLAMGVGNVIISAFSTLGAVFVWRLAYRHRVLDAAGWGAWSWPILFLGEDLCYYWFHRAHHEVRVLWAAHVAHHSSQYFNLSTALRQPWLTPFTGPLFWLPLALIGFAPERILFAQALSLMYQFSIHTEAVRRLPRALEWWLNTPSHHRVHHGKNVVYLDRNHGGVLIIWDRLFGSFEAERAGERVRYGLTHDLESYNPLRIASHEWRAIARDLRRARSLRDAWCYAFAAPGWSPDGSTQTAKDLRRALNNGPER